MGARETTLIRGLVAGTLLGAAGLATPAWAAPATAPEAAPAAAAPAAAPAAASPTAPIAPSAPAPPATPAEEEEDTYEQTVRLFSDQLILIATIIGAIAALPALIEFLIDRRKRKERIALSLADEAVGELRPRLPGFDAVLAGIADLIDRARNPAAYSGVRVGNEVLVIGPPLWGKKMLAQRVAQEARLDRLITVYNPRSADALAKAKALIHDYRRLKVLLLIPRVDLVFEQEDEELVVELEALIESASEREHVLVVGTAVQFEPDSPLDNLFGVKLVLPGTVQAAAQARQIPPEARQVLCDVARFYLDEALAAGMRLGGLSVEQCTARLVEVASNPAEIEDIIAVCETTAIYRRQTRQAAALEITPEVLETAIGRVILTTISLDDTIRRPRRPEGS